MTNTNLPTAIDAAEFQAFIESTNVSQEALNGGGDFLPQLKVNYQDEIEIDGIKKEIKPGLFTLTGQDIPSFAKNVRFRPLLQNFQYVDYNKDEDKVVNRSVLFNDFSTEARDENGTVRCGKPASKLLKEQPELKKQWAHVSLYRSVDGLVSYTGVDPDGKEIVVDNVLCTFRGKGANFAPFQEEYLKLMPKGTFIWDFVLTLGTTKHKQDPKSAVSYYIVHFDADFTDRVPLTADVWEQVKELKRRADATNKEINTKYYSAIEGRNKEDPLPDDLDIESLDSEFSSD
jgi:hypothetical protein